MATNIARREHPEGHKLREEAPLGCALINGGHTPRVLPRYSHSEALGADAPCTSNDPNPDSLKTVPE